MFTSARQFLSGALLALVSTAAVLGTAQAQIFGRSNPAFPPQNRVSSDPRLQQHAANLAALNQAYSQVSPYASGSNPYANSFNRGPTFSNPNSSYQFGNTYNPYLPYGSYGPLGYISGGTNPYYGTYGSSYGSFGLYGSPYSGNFANPYVGFGFPGN